LSHIPIDGFISAFEKSFPNIGISHKNVVSVDTWEKIAEKIYPFIKSFIEELDDQNIYWGYLIEWFHIDIEKIAKDFWKTHKIFVFWYPKISEQEKIWIIRKYDNNNWTNEIKNNELQEHVKLFIKLSKYYKNICKNNFIDFVDTSYNRNEEIEKLIREIKSEKATFSWCWNQE
jgi:hypothetical protein